MLQMRIHTHPIFWRSTSNPAKTPSCFHETRFALADVIVHRGGRAGIVVAMRAAELGASALFVTRDDSLQLEIQVCPGFRHIHRRVSHLIPNA